MFPANSDVYIQFKRLTLIEGSLWHIFAGANICSFTVVGIVRQMFSCLGGAGTGSS